MAGEIKISALTLAGPAADADVTAGVQSGVTKKQTNSALATYMQGKITSQTAYTAGDGSILETGTKPVVLKDTTATGNNSSLLEVFSTTHGSRPFPSMTTTQRNAISTPATGLTVYNATTNTIDYFDGTSWQIGLTLDNLLAGDNITLTQNGDGTVTVASSAITPTGSSDYTGQSCIGNSTSTSIASSNTNYPIFVNGGTFNDITSSNFVNEIVSISGVNTPVMRYTDNASQFFQVNFNIFAKGTVPLQQTYVFTLCIYRADTSIVVTSYSGSIVLQDLIFPASIPLSGVIELNTGDRIFIQVKNTTTAGNGVIVNYFNADAVNVDASANAVMVWTDVTGTSQSMSPQNGYAADNAGLVTLTLPTVANFGSSISVIGKGAGGWQIAQNSGQIIHYLGSATTTGVTGNVQSSNQYACVSLRCIVANTEFVIENTTGSITVN